MAGAKDFLVSLSIKWLVFAKNIQIESHRSLRPCQPPRRLHSLSSNTTRLGVTVTLRAHRLANSLNGDAKSHSLPRTKSSPLTADAFSDAEQKIEQREKLSVARKRTVSVFSASVTFCHSARAKSRSFHADGPRLAWTQRAMRLMRLLWPNKRAGWG